MKKLLMGSAVLTIFALSIILVQISCRKDTTAQTASGENSAQITALTKEEILVERQWRVDQLHRVVNGVYSSYFLGGTNTTGIDYDNTRFTFNSDGTAIYIDENGLTHNATWQFTTADKRELQFIVDGVALNNWQMVEIAENYLHATENITVGGNNNNMHSYRLVQIP